MKSSSLADSASRPVDRGASSGTEYLSVWQELRLPMLKPLIRVQTRGCELQQCGGELEIVVSRSLLCVVMLLEVENTREICWRIE